MPSEAMDVSCQCGAVAFRTPTAAPLSVYHCHCIECRKQSSSGFGTSAIFPAAGLMPLPSSLRDRLSVYRRPGTRCRSGRDMNCYFCMTCGSRVLHHAVESDGTGASVVSIKGGLIANLDWSKAVHIYTEHAVVSIPNDAQQFPGTPPPSPRASTADEQLAVREGSL